MTPEQTRLIEALYQEHHDSMRRVAQKILKDPEAAADAVSQAFLIAILKLDTVAECQDPAKWLFHVLKNTALDEYRRRCRQSAAPLEEIAEVAARSELVSFQELLPQGLTEEEREILCLRIERQMDYARLARHFGLSAGACRMKFSRAKRRCAELLKGTFS